MKNSETSIVRLNHMKEKLEAQRKHFNGEKRCLSKPSVMLEGGMFIVEHFLGGFGAETSSSTLSMNSYLI